MWDGDSILGRPCRRLNVPISYYHPSAHPLLVHLPIFYMYHALVLIRPNWVNYVLLDLYVQVSLCHGVCCRSCLVSSILGTWSGGHRTTTSFLSTSEKFEIAVVISTRWILMNSENNRRDEGVSYHGLRSCCRSGACFQASNPVHSGRCWTSCSQFQRFDLSLPIGSRQRKLRWCASWVCGNVDGWAFAVCFFAPPLGSTLPSHLFFGDLFLCNQSFLGCSAATATLFQAWFGALPCFCYLPKVANCLLIESLTCSTCFCIWIHNEGMFAQNQTFELLNSPVLDQGLNQHQLATVEQLARCSLVVHEYLYLTIWEPCLYTLRTDWLLSKFQRG